MSLRMTRSEREAFLADVHIGVLSVQQDGRGPLSVPVWYTYEPGRTVNVITAEESRKGRLISAAGRFSLCAQTEVAPYKYVSVEGPVVRLDKPADPAERRALAHRYLGRELGDLYIQATEADAARNVVFRMSPEYWLTTDFAKQFGQLRRSQDRGTLVKVCHRLLLAAAVECVYGLLGGPARLPWAPAEK